MDHNTYHQSDRNQQTEEVLNELEADDFLTVNTAVTPESEESKILNEYLYHRVLTRPDVSWRTAARYVARSLAIAVSAAAALTLAYVFLSGKSGSAVLSPYAVFVLLFVLSMGVFVLVYLKRIIIFLVKMYQKNASEDRRGSCCCMPSCSEYMILAVNKYGAVIGVCKGLLRLWRCGRFRGIDYP